MTKTSSRPAAPAVKEDEKADSDWQRRQGSEAWSKGNPTLSEWLQDRLTFNPEQNWKRRAEVIKGLAQQKIQDERKEQARQTAAAVKAGGWRFVPPPGLLVAAVLGIQLHKLLPKKPAGDDEGSASALVNDTQRSSSRSGECMLNYRGEAAYASPMFRLYLFGTPNTTANG